MTSRRTERNRGRGVWGRILLLLAVLPVLVLGPALGGMVAWLHSHGSSGAHLHLVLEHGEHHGAGPSHAWHAHQHRHDGEDETSGGDDEPSPEGLRLELRELVAAAPRAAAPAPATSIHVLALLPAPAWEPARIEGLPPARSHRSVWPPPGSSRSGLAALLRSSHALRI